MLDDPEVADVEYDELVRELQALEDGVPGAHHTGLADAARRRRARPTCSHRSCIGRPMLSLDNAFSFEELEAWSARVEQTSSGDAARLRRAS